MRFFQFLLFLIMGALALLTYIFIFIELDKATEEGYVTVSVVGLLSAFFTFSAYKLLGRVFKASPKVDEDAIRDGIVLSFAASKGGQITPSELATTGHFSIKDARKYLEEMHENNVCEKKWLEGEVYLYTFKGLMQDDEKGLLKESA